LALILYPFFSLGVSKPVTKTGLALILGPLILSQSLLIILKILHYFLIEVVSIKEKGLFF
jgi:hypothetical protein